MLQCCNAQPIGLPPLSLITLKYSSCRIAVSTRYRNITIIRRENGNYEMFIYSLDKIIKLWILPCTLSYLHALKTLYSFPHPSCVLSRQRLILLLRGKHVVTERRLWRLYYVYALSRWKIIISKLLFTIPQIALFRVAFNRIDSHTPDVALPQCSPLDRTNK